ncbi:MAG: ABC transporter ATP-binding protein, partial [Terracidiphilus sp.]
AKDVLLDALAAYGGTVIFVSHDRYFIDRLATRVLEIENGAVMKYEGNYEDYLRRKEALAAPAPEKAPAPQHERTAPVGTTIVIEGGFEETNGAGASPGARSRRLNPIRQKQMKDRCAFLEEEIPRAEAAIAHTEEQLGVYVSAAETQRLTVLAEELRAQLATLTAEWEELTAQLEA